MRKPYVHWTIEKLQEEANKYKTRKEFSKNSSSAYQTAQKNGTLNILFKNHKNNGYNNCRKKDGYWTIKKLQKEANKYQTRGEFYKKNNSAYSVANGKKLINTLFKNHKNKGYDISRVHRGYWTMDKLQVCSNKYETRAEFRKNDINAYSAAKRKKLLNILFKNHKNEGYIDKEEWSYNSYAIYVYEMSEYNKAYVGLTNDIKRRDKEHLFSENELLINFCKDNNIALPKYKILEDDLISIDAQKKEQYWINFYKKNNWHMFNISNGGGLGGCSIKWTKNKLQREAEKYKTVGEFRVNNNHAYISARNKNMLDELFEYDKNADYDREHHLIKYWNIDTLQIEVDKYETREEFRYNSKKAYSAAIRRNLISELFKNHKNNGYTRNFKKL